MTVSQVIHFVTNGYYVVYSCGSSRDAYAKQRFADLSLEQGDYSSTVLELYLSLLQEDPSRRADYYEKISRIYAAQGNDAEAERFEGFAREAFKGR